MVVVFVFRKITLFTNMDHAGVGMNSSRQADKPALRGNAWEMQSLASPILEQAPPECSQSSKITNVVVFVKPFFEQKLDKVL